MRRRRFAIVLALGAVLAGCAVADTTRYYALGMLREPGGTQRPATGSGLTIGVGPVVIPGYLDRPQLVTRDASGSAGTAVTLDARWRVLTRDGKEVAFSRTMLTEPITDAGFSGVVAAMNRSIVRLAADIGDAIQAQPANRAAVRD